MTTLQMIGATVALASVVFIYALLAEMLVVAVQHLTVPNPSEAHVPDNDLDPREVWPEDD